MTTTLQSDTTDRPAQFWTSGESVEWESSTAAAPIVTVVWTGFPSFPSKADVFLWVCRNPGADSEAVSKRFRIGGVEASDIVTELLNEGLLDFAE